VRAAMRGVEAVVHCAQVGSRAPRPLAEAVNLVGAENVLASARALGLARMVFRSGEAVTRGAVARSYVDEEYPAPPRFTDRAAEALSLADELVQAAGGGALSTAVIRPGILWGADDTRWLPGVLRRVLAGRWRWVDEGRAMLPTSHVDSVVDAMVRALALPPEAPRTYYVTDDERVTAREFVTRAVAAAGGGKLAASSLPYWAASALGWWAERGDDPLACTRAEVSRLGQTGFFNVQRARTSLGWVPVVSVDEGMRALGEWAAARGGVEAVARGEVDPKPLG
ncbi:MAG: 3-beta hydroxysteroid dehydrogenase, partial [Myxococcaceae bacterium]|nr:3-beta hydroxysteroid dehydrogenase [Myxococcaceae bacterium]